MHSAVKPYDCKRSGVMIGGLSLGFARQLCADLMAAVEHCVSHGVSKGLY